VDVMKIPQFFIHCYCHSGYLIASKYDLGSCKECITERKDTNFRNNKFSCKIYTEQEIGDLVKDCSEEDEDHQEKKEITVEGTSVGVASMKMTKGIKVTGVGMIVGIINVNMSIG